MTSPRVIVNADDFGLSRGISNAVLTAHKSGILTSASLMANQPSSEYAIQLLQQMPHLGVGIHLNLTAGRPVLPVSEVPSLVDHNGRFHSLAILAGRLWRSRISSAEIEAEFLAQICWLNDRGIAPVHADSHQHVHLYPAALKPFVCALKGKGIRCARAPRCTVWPAAGRAGGPHEGALVRRLAVQAYRAAVEITALRGFAMPHSRISFRSADRRDQTAIVRCWIAALEHLPDREFELTCHPGISERGFSESDRIAAQRGEELRSLTSAEMRDTVEKNRIELIRYADLGAKLPQRESALEASAQ